jgi:hypothetical protein
MHYVPLLALQRSLYAIPAGQARFEAYITRINENGLLPFALMNPMGKPHCLALLDDYLALDTDNQVAQVVASTLPTLEGRVALVLTDDAKGGWTNRWCVEYDLYFTHPSKFSSDGWLTIPLWTSEPADLRNVETNTKLALHRTAYVMQHGPAQTLGAHLKQEGYAITNSGLLATRLPEDEQEYTRDVLMPLLDNHDRPTIFAALYGDEAASSLGYKPLGLSSRAGLSVAMLF